jgi:hypothetical protein
MRHIGGGPSGAGYNQKDDQDANKKEGGHYACPNHWVRSGLGPSEGSQRLGKNSTRPFRADMIGLVSQLSRRPFRP